MIWVYNLSVSVCISLLMLPLWFSKNLVDSSIQIVVSTIGLPLVLIILNLFLLFKSRRKSFLLLYLVVPVSCLLSQLIGYIGWGISTGGLLCPDWETVILTAFLSMVSVGFSLVVLALSHVVLKIFHANMLRSG